MIPTSHEECLAGDDYSVTGLGNQFLIPTDEPCKIKTLEPSLPEVDICPLSPNVVDNNNSSTQDTWIDKATGGTYP